MRNYLTKTVFVAVAIASWVLLGSWTGGPAPGCEKDSLAIVRIIKPINELFNVEPLVVVSKGQCKIEEVTVSDSESGNGDLLGKRTLTDFLSNGYTIQTATEEVESGMRLNTYYLKKKVI